MNMILKDVYLQPEAKDEILSEARVLELASEFVPSAKKLTAVDETGGEARTYAIDANIIMKIQRPHKLRPRTSLEKEVFMLRQIEKQCGINVPRVLGYSKKSNLLEFTILTRLPGNALKYTTMLESELETVLVEHGRNLKELHSMEQKALIECGLFPNDETVENVKLRFTYRLDLMLEGMLKNVAKEEIEIAKKLGDEIIAQIPNKLKMVALHSNPYKEHTFVNADKSYSGMIDFGDSYISHPVNDMRRWSFKERKHLLQGYTSVGDIGDDFMTMWNINYQIDAMLDVLNKTGTLAEIGSKSNLLEWE